MKGVDTIARVRRAYFVQGKSIKQIERELHVARNTVRKIICSGETRFSYEREIQPLPAIGPWQAELDRLLLTNEGKPSRERLTLIRIYEELCGLGYEGSYDAVRRYGRRWSRERNRKNALFAGHDAGAENWAIIASLIETRKLNSVDPHAWLTATLRAILADRKHSRINDLLSWNYASNV